MANRSDMLTAMLVDVECSLTIDRVKNLIRVYESISGSGRGRRAVDTSDILRSAVVFLHATFEEAMRMLVRRKFPEASARVLDTVPLKNLSSSGRPEKFFLGALISFKGKSVDEVIEESVEEYLSHFTVNNVNDVNNLLRSFQISSHSIKPHLSSLAQMLARRHLIVHRADSASNRGKGHYLAKSLSKSTVLGWIKTVETIIRKLTQELAYPS